MPSTDHDVESQQANQALLRNNTRGSDVLAELDEGHQELATTNKNNQPEKSGAGFNTINVMLVLACVGVYTAGPSFADQAKSKLKKSGEFNDHCMYWGPTNAEDVAFCEDPAQKDNILNFTVGKCWKKMSFNTSLTEEQCEWTNTDVIYNGTASLTYKQTDGACNKKCYKKTYPFNSACLVTIQNFAELIICLLLTITFSPRKLCKCFDPRAIKDMIIVSFVACISYQAEFLAIQYGDSNTFTVFKQMNIVVTAAMAYMFLRVAQSKLQTSILFIFTLLMVVFAFQKDASAQLVTYGQEKKDMSEYISSNHGTVSAKLWEIVPILDLGNLVSSGGSKVLICCAFSLLKVLGSCASTVLMEKALKNADASDGFFIQVAQFKVVNIPMSLLIAFIFSCFEKYGMKSTSSKGTEVFVGYFDGLTTLGYFTIGTYVLKNFIVNIMLKRISSIVKTLAECASVIAIYVIAIAVTRTEPADPTTIVLTGSIIICIVSYAISKSAPAAPKPVAKGDARRKDGL
jgi:uncharacterized membrane protein